MSGLLAGKVWQSNLHPDLKPLAAALADIGNDDGTSIYPSVAYMAWLLGRSTRSVQDNLKKLRYLKVLKVVTDLNGGRYRSTEYQLVESALPTREKWQTNHAIASGFRPKKGPACSEKQRSLRLKLRSLEHESTNPSSYKPLRTVIEPSVEPRPHTQRPASPLPETQSSTATPPGKENETRPAGILSPDEQKRFQSSFLAEMRRVAEDKTL
jgi:hypothetical protein